MLKVSRTDGLPIEGGIMSKKKLFGDYLVGKKLLTEDQLLDILIEQLRDQPSIAEIIHEGTLLPRHQQLDILRIQNQDHCSYQQACEKLGVWTNELQQQVTTASEAKRTPIGQLLVKNTTLKFSDLAKALDDYLVDDSHPITVAIPEVKPDMIEPLAVKVSKAQTTNTELPNFENTLPVESLLLVELLNIIHDSKLYHIESNFNFLKSCLSMPDAESRWDELIHTLVSDIKLMKESARFVRAELTENIFQTMELAVSELSWGYATARPANCMVLFEACKAAFIVVRGIRSALIEHGLEKTYWDKPENQKEYHDAIKSIQTKINDLGSDVNLQGAA